MKKIIIRFRGHCGHANILALIAGLLTALAFSSAYAVTTSVDPGQVEQRFEDRVPAPVDERTGPLTVEPSANHLPKGAENKRFTLKTVAIDGSTVYTLDKLKPLFADELGKEISLADAQRLAERVTLKYRNDGYILSQALIPQQSLKDGVLHIRVVEGFIAHVTIQGEVKDSRATTLVESYAQSIKQARPLNTATLERYLLLMNDLPGATAKAVVQPSADTFGAADLVITLTNKLMDGSESFDNRGTKYIGPHQFTTTLDANSLFNMYERTLARFITTGTDELQYFDLEHEEQLSSEGTKLTLTASHSHTDPGYTLAPLDIVGNSDDYSAKVTQPFERSRTENLTGRLLFDYRNTNTDELGSNLSEDRLRTLRGGGEFDFADHFHGVDLIDMQLSQGLNILNPSSSGLDRSRTDGDSAFTKINMDFTRTHNLPYGFSVLTAASGQYSFSNLLAAEQFSLGGPGFGGAYDPAELTGDQGVAGKIELRYGRAPGYEFFNSYQAFAYYDIGKVWNRDDTTPVNNSLASLGTGVRSNFTQWLSGSAEIGVPLTKKVATEDNNDPRIFFSLTGRF